MSYYFTPERILIVGVYGSGLIILHFSWTLVIYCRRNYMKPNKQSFKIMLGSNTLNFVL